ncbi:MAG TPA: hypothetical protein VEO94_06120, partial [Candidatus Dormibacteraeota bacterium]|nr:hypothetical protein [Candidatus Dormibacteraeota bacterium]
SLTVVALAAGAVAGLPRARRWGEEALRRAIERRASALLGGPVHVGRLHVEFYPAAVHLEAVDAGRRGNRGSEATGTADEVSLRAGLLTFLRANHGPFTVKVKRPHLHVYLAAGRPLAAASDGSTGEAAALAIVPAGSTLEVRDGVFEVELAAGPGVRFEGVLLRAGPQPGGVIAGHGEFAAGVYKGPGGDWPGLSGAAEFQAKAGEVRLDHLAIHAEGLAVSGSATVATGAPLSVDGAFEAGVEMDKLARFFPDGAAPSGRMKASLAGSLRDGRPQARGNLEVTDLTLWGLTIGTLRSDLLVDEAVHLKGIRAHLLGGEWTGSTDIALAGDHLQGTCDLRLDGIDAGQVLEFAGWGGPPLTGTIHYSGQHSIDSSGLKSLRGSGVIDAVGQFRSRRGDEIPLEVTTDLSSEGDTVRLVNGSLRAGSTRAGFSGTVTRGEGIRLKMSGGTGNLAEILPLFAPPKKKPAAAEGKARPPARPQKAPPPRARPPGHAPGAARPASNRTPSQAPSIVYASWPPRAAARGAGGAKARPAGPESPLEKILQSLGGRWDWDGDLSYGRRGLEFTGTLRGSDLTYDGTPIGSLRGRVVYRADVLSIEEAVLRLEPDATVHLDGRIDFRGDGAVGINARAERFPLGPILKGIGMTAPV